MIRFTIHPLRCYVFHRRIHHALIGFLLIVHDRKDWRHWFTDLWVDRLA